MTHAAKLRAERYGSAGEQRAQQKSLLRQEVIFLFLKLFFFISYMKKTSQSNLY